jgi:hypothetical protein
VSWRSNRPSKVMRKSSDSPPSWQARPRSHRAVQTSSPADDGSYFAYTISPSMGFEVGRRAQTVSQAEAEALANSVQQGQHGPYHQRYRGDCQGVSWVRHGFLAVVTTYGVNHPVARGQAYAWGTAWADSGTHAVENARNFCNAQRAPRHISAPWRGLLRLGFCPQS